MSKDNPSKRDLEMKRIRQGTVFKLIDRIASIVRTAVRTGGWVGVSYFAYKTVGLIAGLKTEFKFEFSAVLEGFLEHGHDRWIWIAIAAAASTAYAAERRLRLRTVRQLTARTKALELQLDPGRSSSGLLPTGQPRKGDRDET